MAPPELIHLEEDEDDEEMVPVLEQEEGDDDDEVIVLDEKINKWLRCKLCGEMTSSQHFFINHFEAEHRELLPFTRAPPLRGSRDDGVRTPQYQPVQANNISIRNCRSAVDNDQSDSSESSPTLVRSEQRNSPSESEGSQVQARANQRSSSNGNQESSRNIEPVQRNQGQSQSRPVPPVGTKRDMETQTEFVKFVPYIGPRPLATSTPLPGPSRRLMRGPSPSMSMIVGGRNNNVASAIATPRGRNAGQDSGTGSVSTPIRSLALDMYLCRNCDFAFPTAEKLKEHEDRLNHGADAPVTATINAQAQSNQESSNGREPRTKRGSKRASSESGDGSGTDSGPTRRKSGRRSAGKHRRDDSFLW